MDECAQHPGGESINTCPRCGGSFCRVCTPPVGLGQICPGCFQATDSAPEGEAGSSRGEASWLQRDALEVVGGLLGRRRGERRKPGVGEQDAGGLTHAHGVTSVEKPRDRGEKRQAAHRLKGRFRSVTSQFSPGNLAAFAKSHFPIVLAERERCDDFEVLARVKYRLVVLTVAATAGLVLVISLTGRRSAWYPLGVALAVAVAVIAFAGGRNGLIVGVTALAVTAMAVVLSEVAVQVLYRAGAIGRLDLTAVDSKTSGGFFMNYYYGLLVRRLLPSMAVAFLVGLWPLPLRPAWRGFRAAGG